LSALTGEGIEALEDLVSTTLTAGRTRYRISLGSANGAGAAWLHSHGAVENEQRTEEETTITVLLTEADYARFQSRGG